METKTKLLIALLLAISLVTAVTALANTVYLPLVPKYPTYTPTATVTLTVTPTLTPTKSATPTKTPTPSGVYILSIEYDPDPAIDEYVVLENNGNKSQNMTGWRLVENNKGVKYFFPDNFTLGADKSVKIWTKRGVDSGTNLYWNQTEPVWNNKSDAALLRDDENDIIDTYSYGDLFLAAP